MSYLIAYSYSFIIVTRKILTNLGVKVKYSNVLKRLEEMTQPKTCRLYHAEITMHEET